MVSEKGDFKKEASSFSLKILSEMRHEQLSLRAAGASCKSQNNN